MITLLTQRDVIRSVVRRYKKQYPDSNAGSKYFSQSLARLEALDLETAAPEDVTDAIFKDYPFNHGSGGWTDITCNCCGEIVERVVKFPGVAAGEYGDTNLCFTCLDKIWTTFNGKVSFITP